MVEVRRLDIEGVLEIQPARYADDRGFFSEVWSRERWREAGIDTDFVQDNHSLSKERGVLRGLHYQAQPHWEAKLVRCTAGAIYDVVLDLRRDSPTFLRWHGVELSSANRLALYIPAGCAHGFQTLEDDCEVAYQISEFYHPECSRPVRWNDRAFGIEWPLPVAVMSAADQTYPDFKP